ncbi:MAG TPA: hypothetical protein VFF43_08495 [Caldimonas sp.]|nr:hypothetical protein [Caldimonas sp.]
MTPETARAVETLLRLRSRVLDADVRAGQLTQQEATAQLAAYLAELVRVAEIDDR